MAMKAPAEANRDNVHQDNYNDKVYITYIHKSIDKPRVRNPAGAFG